ncbi:MAG: DUF5054 domain-containing protein [Anaerolineae bacterium]
MHVHLIFKTHLDIGFTDYARNVVAGYFNVFIPKALDTAHAMRQQGKRFVWTTGSWLIYEYLEQASPAQRKRMEEAIALGDIAWHGLPFTTHTELMDASLFRFGISLSQTLDKRFGKQTIAAKMTDVPGHTRGIVPLLAEAGIRFLHIGVNPASTPPDVPPVFVWQDDSGARLLLMYQKGAYGDAVSIPGLDDALAFAHTSDNIGPQSLEQALRAYDETQAHFPDATIAASTLDAFAARLLTVEDQLPVITAELGDTWIHGVGTDPKKVARYRALLRLRQKWLGDAIPSPDDPLHHFSRRLMLVPEHTWGMDEKTHLKDYTYYRPDQLRTMLNAEPFTTFAASWAEQRAYIDEAVAALGQSAQAQEARAVLAALEPKYPHADVRLRTTERVFKTRYFDIGFDQRGAMTRLLDLRSKRSWASNRRPLALLRYQTFSSEDYDQFYDKYIINKRKTRIWSVDDYTKPGMETAGQPSYFWDSDLKWFYADAYDGGQRFLLEMRAPQEAYQRWGCPRDFTLEIDLPDAAPEIHFNLQWFEKPASRLPEALWFSFIPQIAYRKMDAAEPVAYWTMDKLGKRISPLESFTTAIAGAARGWQRHSLRGGKRLPRHRGLNWMRRWSQRANRRCCASSTRYRRCRNGMHFNLYNNVWNTNFPMWYSEDARFRFILQL